MYKQDTRYEPGYFRPQTFGKIYKKRYTDGDFPPPTQVAGRK